MKASDMRMQDFNPTGAGRDSLVKIAIIGVGGGGSNAVNNLKDAGVSRVTFMAINTDRQALCESKADKRVQIGSELTKGFGAGAKMEVGRQAAEECKETLTNLIKDMDLIFIAAGMGGGTGTGAAPVIAEIAHNLGILTVAFVTTPFAYEGDRRMSNAQVGIANLRKYVDSLLIVPNERLNMVAKNLNMTLDRAFQYADDILRQSVLALTNIILSTGRINIDFADICTVLRKGGDTIIGIGRASGANRAIEAVRKAVNNPVLGTSIEGASQVIICIEGNEIKMDENNDVATLVRGVCAPGVNVISGYRPDPDLKDEMQVTVIATGFNKPDEQQTQRSATLDKLMQQAQAEQRASGQIMQQSASQPPFERRASQRPQSDGQLSLFDTGNYNVRTEQPAPPPQPAPQPQQNKSSDSGNSWWKKLRKQ